MDRTRILQNQQLSDILRYNPSAADIQYLIDGLEAIKNKYLNFMDPLRLDDILRNEFELYKDMDHTEFFPSYRGMNFEKFEHAYNEKYFIHHAYLTVRDVQEFNWIGSFEVPTNTQIFTPGIGFLDLF